jgi:hypothetical protein
MAGVKMAQWSVEAQLRHLVHHLHAEERALRRGRPAKKTETEWLVEKLNASSLMPPSFRYSARPKANRKDERMAKSTAGIGPKGQAKAARVFKEYGKGELHSGSKGGPTVTSHDQAIAIALAQARKASRAKGSK